MVNPEIDINNVGKVADFFGLVELGQAINDKLKDDDRDKKWEVMLVAGTWVTNRPVPTAMEENYCKIPYVISRMGGGRLEMVKATAPVETVLVDHNEHYDCDRIDWLEMKKGNIPFGAIKVGRGDKMFIGRKKYRIGRVETTTIGYVTERGEFKRTFAWNPPSCRELRLAGVWSCCGPHCSVVRVDLNTDPTDDDTFSILCCFIGPTKNVRIV